MAAEHSAPDGAEHQVTIGNPHGQHAQVWIGPNGAFHVVLRDVAQEIWLGESMLDALETHAGRRARTRHRKRTADS